MQITHHTDLLNALIEKNNLKSYLEIGAGNLGYNETVPSNPLANFNKIKCEFKYGVDPAISGNNIFQGTSDEYYAKNSHVKFDIIFLDGDHTKEQLKRDFENSLRCLSDNGFIVIHDTLPDEEQYTIIPRQTKKWFGNVYQFAMHLNGYDNIGFITFNIDCGCTLVWKELGKKGMTELFKNDWQHYKSVGKVALNITDEVQI